MSPKFYISRPVPTGSTNTWFSKKPLAFELLLKCDGVCMCVQFFSYSRKNMVTRCGIVTEVNAANRVKRDTCSKNFRRVLKLIERVFKKMCPNGVWRDVKYHTNLV